MAVLVIGTGKRLATVELFSRGEVVIEHAGLNLPETNMAVWEASSLS